MKPYYGTALSSVNTIENTKHYTQLILDQSVPGVLVECGVAAGAQVAAMQDTLLGQNQTRWIYGFDSFEGIPLASDEDDQQPGIEGPKPIIHYSDKRQLLKSSGVTVHRLESVRSNMRKWFPGKDDTIVLVKGWFQDTLKPYRTVMQQHGGIALLRLDGDLYESTKVCLEELFEFMNPGAILIIDDWTLVGCRRACDEFFATHPVTRLSEPHHDGGPAYFRV